MSELKTHYEKPGGRQDRRLSRALSFGAVTLTLMLLGGG